MSPSSAPSLSPTRPRSPAAAAPLALGLLAAVLHAAIFGFFYAWVCSTMWGLDAADPRTAIAAMQAMNASVRNAVFAPAFFGTPVVAALAAVTAWGTAHRRAAGWFLLAAIVYGLGGLLLTLLVSVPMNEELGRTAVPTDPEGARALWAAYSAPWQRWNVARTLASGLALLCSLLGLVSLRRRA